MPRAPIIRKTRPSRRGWKLLAVVAGFSVLVALATPVQGQSDPAPDVPQPTAQGLIPRMAPPKPDRAVITEGYSPGRLHVKFVEGTSIRLRTDTLTSLGDDDTAGLGRLLSEHPDLRFERLFSRPEAELTAEKRELEARSSRQQADLNLYYRFFVPAGVEAEDLIDQLNALDIVEIAYAEPLAQPPPVAIDYETLQGYLNPAADGVDARYGWTQPGGRGGNVTIFDIETDWNYTHEDLSEIAEPGTFIENGDSCDFGSGTDHGTAVVGQLVGDRNGKGVTGGVYEADLFTVNRLNVSFGFCVTDTSDSISIAAALMQPGDVMLLETQVEGPDSVCSGVSDQDGLVPEEWVPASYDAIVAAVSAGIIVVEPAGNGGCNLDLPIYGSPFPQGRPDSGAIIVGSGSRPGWTAPTHGRLDFSNYGARVDLQGWGQGVVTTGYGDLFPGPHEFDPPTNEDYTDTFGGTSSASPIVTTAAVALSSMAQQQGMLLTSREIRTLLMGTGTPQAFGLAGNIGPLPNIEEAVRQAAPTAQPDHYTVAKGGTITATSSFVADVEPNSTLADANSVDGHFTLGHNSDVGNAAGNVSTVSPHVTVEGTGDATVDLFKFTVSSVPTNAIFDIDGGHGGTGSFDATLRVLDSAGTELIAGDDSDFQQGAAGSLPSDTFGTSETLDTYIEYEITAPGSYYVEVSAFDGAPNQPVPAGADYQLQIVIPGMATAPTYGVLENDTDLARPGDQLSATLTNSPLNGAVTLRSDGSFTYIHGGSADLVDSFGYSVSDGVSTRSAIVTINGPSVGLVDASAGQWHLRNTGGVVTSFYYGNPGDLPISGDWDGNGTSTPGLYRQSDGFFYARNTNTVGTADAECFAGDPADVPLAGDWDGDGDDNLGIYRPSEQKFYLFTITCTGTSMGAAPISFLFGNPGDKPVVGDWDGDGIDEVGLHRESTGFFYWRNTHTTGNDDGAIFFGDPDDRLISGDWGNVDGIDTPAIFRPSNVTFFFRHTLTEGNADSQLAWPGAGTGWLPISGTFGLG